MATQARPPLDFMTYEQWFDEVIDQAETYTHHLMTREEHSLGTLDESSTNQPELVLPKLQKPALHFPPPKYPISSRLLHDKAAITKRNKKLKTAKDRKRDFIARFVRPGCVMRTGSWVDDMIAVEDERLPWLKPEPRQVFEINTKGLEIQEIYPIADLGYDQPGADEEDGGRERKANIPAINADRWQKKVNAKHKCNANLHRIIGGGFFQSAMEELDRDEGRDGLCDCPYHLG